ncbi:MAG: heme A synthase [Spirulinaceae cyanobacterium SM2_1_0]|nr:heme A synthase [Spirulinaceae cyanobacterium SM2_1_0]
MTDSVLQRQTHSGAIADNSKVYQARIRNLIGKLAIATFLLMAVGSATRVMNAGLACPDWPLCYGQLVPTQQMNLQVFLEWFHRLDAMLIGFTTLALVGLCWWWRRSLPGWLPWVALLALSLVLVQGLLGGLTVTEMLRFDIVTAHLGTALLFFGLLLGMATCLQPYQGTGSASKLPWLAGLAALAIYVQSLLGALVGSRWALHQCLNASQLCTIMNSHLLGVVPATLLTLAVPVLAWRTPALHPTLRQLARWSVALVVLQILLGFATFHFHLQVEPLTVSHQAIGAALFGVLIVFAVLAARDRAAQAMIAD